MSKMQAVSTQTGNYPTVAPYFGEKAKQNRNAIPTKQNPPPGMNKWLSEFQVCYSCLNISIYYIISCYFLITIGTK